MRMFVLGACFGAVYFGSYLADLEHKRRARRLRKRSKRRAEHALATGKLRLVPGGRG